MGSIAIIGVRRNMIEESDIVGLEQLMKVLTRFNAEGVGEVKWGGELS